MSNNTEKIINGLETARQKDPALTDVTDLHRALLEAQGRVTSVSVPDLPFTGEIEQLLQQGIPLLHVVPLLFDWQEVSRLAADICHTIAEHRPDLVDTLATASAHLISQNGQIERLVTRYLNGESLDLVADQSQPVDPNLLTFLLNQTLRPFLQSAIRDLQSKIPNLPSKIDRWSRPICPMCGGPPDFAALTSGKNNDSHSRRLLCLRCDTEWGYQRSGCPFCGQTEQWAYFLDDNEVFRLYVCDSCHRYLKTVDWRQTFAHRSLPVARIITAGMDLAAAQAGYT